MTSTWETKLNQIFTPVSCQECGIDPGPNAAPQVCYQNNKNGIAVITKPGWGALTCMSFNALAINSASTFVGDTFDYSVQDTFCLSAPFDQAQRTNIETLLANTDTCADVDPAQCAAQGCEGGGLACCANMRSVLVDCLPNNDGTGTYNAYFQCEPFSCSTGFTAFNGQCYRDAPVTSGQSQSDGTNCCGRNSGNVQGYRASIGSGSCGPTYTMVCAPGGHGGCADTAVSSVNYKDWYCNTSGIDSSQTWQNLSWTQCTNPQGCVNPTFSSGQPSMNHYYFDMNTSNGGYPACSALPGTLQYCPWSPPQ